MDTYLFIHVVLSFIGLFTGLVVMLNMLSGRHSAVWTLLFLLSTVLTSLTGFILPADKLLPSHIVGLLSLLVLGFAVHAYYIEKLQRRWRLIYAISATIAFYFNSFVAVVQAFLKIPALYQLAPTQTELPFVVAQTLLLLLFVIAGLLAAKRLPALAPSRMGMQHI